MPGLVKNSTAKPNRPIQQQTLTSRDASSATLVPVDAVATINYSLAEAAVGTRRKGPVSRRFTATTYSQFLLFHLQFLPKYGYHEVMTTITLDEIQRDFLGCLKRVEAGETLVIVQADKPLAELKPVASNGTQPRPSGLCAGEFRTPDDFNDPLPEDVLKQFDGS